MVAKLASKMSGRGMWLGVGPVALGACLTFAGCTETSPDGVSGPIDLEVPCADVEAAVYGPQSGMESAEKGAILKCSPYKTWTAAEVTARLQNASKDSTPAATPTPAKSGAKVYRVTYRTERGTEPPTPGTSVALVYLPDTPIASKVPILVAARGSRGQAAACAPSLFSPEGAYVQDDFEALVLPFIGEGFAVIAPDLAGYSNFGAPGNPPSAFASVEDIGRSTLDSSRALRKLIPSRVQDKVVIVGHSQGGHSALGSLALSATYGAAAPIAGVATYAPLWVSNRSWGALFLLENFFPIGSSPATPVSIWYHYTHGELLDGPGGGLLPFKPSAHGAVKQFVDSQCWASDYPGLKAVGTVASDFFTDEFKNAVSGAAGFGTDCPTGPAEVKATCEKWVKRYVADRPAITGDAAKVPLLVAIGGKDTTIPIDRLKCAADKLDEQKLPVTYCVNQEADHGGIVRAEATPVVQWVAEKTLGIPATAKCPSSEVKFKDKDGKDVVCAYPPPND